MEKHWKCTEGVSVEPSVLTGVVRQGCAESEGRRMWWGDKHWLLDCVERPWVAYGGPPKSVPLDKRPPDLCLDPWATWSSQHQSATSTIFEELNWKFVPLYLSKTLLSITSPTLVFTRLCGFHSDTLLVSRALFLAFLGVVGAYPFWVLFSYWLILGKVLLLCHILKYIKRWPYFLFLTFQFNSHWLCFIGFFSSQKNSSISVQFLQNSNTLVEIWFVLLRQVGISNYTVS